MGSAGLTFTVPAQCEPPGSARSQGSMLLDFQGISFKCIWRRAAAVAVGVNSVK